MNSVPFAFYDAMTRLLSSRFTNCCIELSGLIGAVASETDQKLAYEWIKIERGQFLQTNYQTLIDNSVIASINPNYRRFTAFYIKGSLEEPSTDAIVAYQNVPAICLHFYTSAISKEFMERIHSLRFISVLYFVPGSADLIPVMMRNFVAKKTLNHVWFFLDYVFDEPTETLLLDLLKQEQFSSVRLPAKSSSTLKRIIAEWKENSEKLIGKRVFTQNKSNNKRYQAEVQAGRIRECTEDEKRSFKLYYGWIGSEDPQISTNQEGGAIYWNRYTSESIQLLFA